ncbi:hypothetical protein PFICI_07029 [Pestalotiopsis fici W106-1]|uniref:Glycosyltransferase 2-like domain-containing protein n=1 Tax=Pestalotiopsis fici (strain W106-1 / CGMCC3.15140) TaxID=1229662 RepID=W3X9E1_PESFW|nr:uncharacterized protein PFICI_07029 [Pestalotiopsis fici W106-1]ETS82027.1 hypothetical protein PFICI_07029 [Pestalotiopsis fici W106-1]
MSALLPLAGFWAWGQAEKALFRRALAAYKPVPISSDSPYTTAKVSILVCTVNTLLARCLRTWLDNKPLEVIIVTIAEHHEQIRSVVENAELSDSDLAKVIIIASAVKGKRAQMVAGIQHARGDIIANVDDHITWHPRLLENMLPCFEDEFMGAVGPAIEGVIPDDRRNEKVITPYEVAAMRLIWDRNPKHKVAWSAGRWSWGVTGASYLIRAEIFKDPDFIKEFIEDNWRGKKLDVGEDTFISRWMQTRDWVISYQSVGPETDVFRTVKTTSDYFSQMFRWERSTIQSHLRQTQLPQVYRSFFVARKTWGRLMRPGFTTAHIVAWIVAFRCNPFLALLFVAWYILEAYPSYKAFFAKYPYMRRFWWAAVAQDYFYIVQDYYCWATLKNTSWESRSVSVEDQNRLK